jgi:hypothetical protein
MASIMIRFPPGCKASERRFDSIRFDGRLLHEENPEAFNSRADGGVRWKLFATDTFGDCDWEAVTATVTEDLERHQSRLEEALRGLEGVVFEICLPSWSRRSHTLQAKLIRLVASLGMSIDLRLFVEDAWDASH